MCLWYTHVARQKVSLTTSLTFPHVASAVTNLRRWFSCCGTNWVLVLFNLDTICVLSRLYLVLDVSLIILVPVIIFTVMWELVAQGWSTTKQALIRFAQGHNWGSNPKPLDLKSSTLPLSNCVSILVIWCHDGFEYSIFVFIINAMFRILYLRNKETQQTKIKFLRV